MNTPPRIKVLFLCTGNSCRSQMAEGWTRALKGSQIEAYSAGIETHGLNPLAVKVMAEAGVDISGHLSKTIADLPVACNARRAVLLEGRDNRGKDRHAG